MRAAYRQVRAFVLLARPAVVLLMGLVTAVGTAQAGRPEDVAVLPALLAVLGFLVASVAWNDLADEQVDAVNVPDRPLAAGRADHRQVIAVGVAGTALALAAAAWIGPLALAVTAAGAALSAAYSLPPARLSGRGVLGPLVLPFGFVAVPLLDGVLAAGPVGRADLVLLAGLYLGFVARMLLKDFRDVRGDALFGKRTFLVRHGRARTCRLSATFWVASSTAVLAVRDVTPQLVIGWLAGVGLVLWLLRELTRCTGRRREDALIVSVALVGRGQLVLLLVHFGLLARGYGPVVYTAALAFLTVMFGVLVAGRLAEAPRGSAPADQADQAVAQIA